MKRSFLKKITSLSMAFILVLATLGVIPVNAETGSLGDGYAYLYFDAASLDVEAPENCKVAYSVNDGELVYVTSNFAPHWERINVDDLIPGEANKITFYTGDTNGILNESLSRNDAGTGCCDYVISTSTLALVLPNGKVLETVGEDIAITKYSPKDAATALNVNHVATTSTETQIAIGDDNLTKAYKVEVVFYEEGAWDGTNDPEQKEIPEMKHVSLQLGGTPDEKRFVWYSFSTAKGYVQITTADKLVNGEMPANAEQVEATSSVSGDTDYYSFHAIINGLSMNTEYAYRVGNDVDGWSPVYKFKTDDYELPYNFLATGDIQIGQLQEVYTVREEYDGWNKSITNMTNAFPEASFLLSLGDQVSDAHIQSQYDGLFEPAPMKSFPLAVTYGNHDPNQTWTKHYSIPNTTPYGVQGSGACDYSFVYGDVLYMHIASSGGGFEQQHLTFIEETMKAHPDVKWHVVIMHHAFFGASDQNTEFALRDFLAPELSRLGIDVVLDGHQHLYCRSKMMNGMKPNEDYDYTKIKEVVNPTPGDILYMTLSSGSGSAYNNVREGTHIAAAFQTETANMSNVEITENSFSITTYQTDNMTVLDEFAIKREGDKPVVKTVLVSPKTSTVKTGYSQQFKANVFGYNNHTQDVIWSVSGNKSDLTSINANGVLSIDVDETAETLTVTATSAINKEKSYSVEVSVSGNAKLINDDFQSGAEGTIINAEDGTRIPWNGWTITGPSKTQVNDTVISLEKEKYTSSDKLTNNMFAKIKRTAVPNSNSANVQLTQDVTPFAGGMFSVKFRVAGNETAGTFDVILESYKGESYNSATDWGTTTYSFNFDTGRVSGNGLTTKNNYITENDKWYDFEILADVDNNKVYVYCNGELVTTGTAESLYGLYQVKFKSNRTVGATAAGGAFYLDDVCVKQMTSEDAVREAARKTANGLKGRISADTITLPTIGYYDTAISWKSSDTSVVNAQTGAVTRPQSGDPLSVTLTATAEKGTETFSYDIPVLVNPQSVIFDEGFEQPRSFNGQTLDGFNSWERASIDTTEGRIIDSVFTVADDTTNNKALSLARLAGVSDHSKEYIITKALPEVLNDTKASLKFKIKRTSDALGQVALYLYNSDKSQVLKTSIKLSDCSILSGENSSKQMFFDGGSAHIAEKDAWYNFEMLFDLENGVCAFSEGDVIYDTASISQLSEIAYIGISTERADEAISSSETYVDDIIFNKLTDSEYETLKDAYTASRIDSIRYSDNSLQITISNKIDLRDGTSLYVAVSNDENSSLNDVAVINLDESQRAEGEQIINVSELLLKEPSSFVKVFIWQENLIPVCKTKGATINPGN